MPQAVIVDAVRTPIGRAFKGSFARTRSDDLGAAAVGGLVKRTGVDPASVDDLLMGCAMTESVQGGNIARQVGFLAGLPESVAAATINRYCASSTYAIGAAVAQVQAGQSDCIIAGGLETMSMIPMTTLTEGEMVHPGLAKARPGFYDIMIKTAERVAKDYKISREDQDYFGVRSHNLAQKANDADQFKGEIVPVTVEDEEHDTQAVVDRDDGIRRNATYEATSQLPAIFGDGYTVTAGNASQMSDGAAATLVTSQAFAEEHGLKVKATVEGAAVAGVAPESMGIGPIPAVQRLQERTGFAYDDLDMFEINEAFAAQALACVRQLGVPEELVNQQGGAIALGHPLGATGARIAAHIVNQLGASGGGKAVETMCVGGGQGYALLWNVH